MGYWYFLPRNSQLPHLKYFSAMAWMWLSWLSTRVTSPGSSERAFMASTPSVRDNFWWRPRSRASRVRMVSWEMKILVEATPISGPAWLYMPASVSLEMELPTTLTIPRSRAPFRRASRMAANVSAVSPDWLIPIMKVFGGKLSLRYLNSEANSTSTSISVNSSKTYLPTQPA